MDADGGRVERGARKSRRPISLLTTNAAPGATQRLRAGSIGILGSHEENRRSRFAPRRDLHRR